MPSPFAGLEDLVSAEIDTVFGEAFDLRPMVATSVNVKPGADVSRPARVVTAIFDDRFADVSPVRGRAAVQVSSTEPRLSLDVSAIPYRLHIGDHMRRHDTGDIYQISDVRPDGVGRVVCRLRQIGTSP